MTIPAEIQQLSPVRKKINQLNTIALEKLNKSGFNKNVTKSTAKSYLWKIVECDERKPHDGTSISLAFPL